MTASFEIGAARESDLEQLVELLGMLFAQEREFRPDAQRQRHALAAILADPGVGRVFVARRRSQILAMVSVLYTISTAEGGRAGLLEDLIVRPSERRRGLASALLRHVIHEARRDGLTRLTLHTDHDNTGAQALYRKFGFAASTMTPMRLRLS